MNRFTLSLFAFSFFAGFIFLGCGQGEKEKSESRRRKRTSIDRVRFVQPEPVSQQYVGSEACRRCHSEIMKEYESHPMSRSMAISKDTQFENYEGEQKFPAGEQVEYWVSGGDKVVHGEIIKNRQDEKISEHEEEIDFTCGSGTRGCSYFVFENGKLFQSPITWYAKSKKWDLSPGYDPKHHPRFGRMASDGCMACHAGRMNPVEGERSTFVKDKPFHELSIGCERCHGPAHSHIDFHENNSGSADGKDPIVNPENLSPKLRDAVCYQCHLQGEHRVTRYGRTEYDFRPGMHVSDVWITFLKTGDTSGGKADAVSQVEQMQQSECYMQSKGELGCISCHDPHRSPSPTQRIEFYRDKCIACHSNATATTECSLPLDERKKSSPEDSCIQCHMPSLNAGDVPHTAQTDHRVHIPGKSFEYEFHLDEGFRVWNDKKVPVHSVERAKTIARSEPAFLRSDLRMAELAMEGMRFFHPVAKDDLSLNESLAQLYSAKGDPVEADRVWSSLIKRFPRDEFLLTQVSLALHQTGKFKEAYPYYRQLSLVNNRRPQVLLRYLDVCTKLNKFQEGIAIANRILELDPGLKIAHEWLARAYETGGDAEKAKFHNRMSKELPK